MHDERAVAVHRRPARRLPLLASTSGCSSNLTDAVVPRRPASTAPRRGAVPPMWNVRIVSCVPGSPIDCAAMTPTASPSSTMLAGRQVAAVALGADAAARLAGQHRADLDLLDAGLLNPLREVFVDLLVGLDDRSSPSIGSTSVSSATRPTMRSRSGSMISPPSMIGPTLDAVERAAVVLGDDHVLRHVDQTARQVARVGGLQRRVGQTLAGAVRRDEVLQHRQAFAEVRRDRRLDDLARRLGHQAAHAGELADLLLAAARAGVGHDEDRVEARPALSRSLHLARTSRRRPSRSPPTRWR